MREELDRLLADMKPALPASLLVLGGLLIGMGLMWLASHSRIHAAKELERQAIEGERLRAALFEPTAAAPIVKPKVTVRLGYQLARDWARELFTVDALPDWAPGEIAALPPSQIAPANPPLRSRGVLPQARLKWPLRRSNPSPLLMPKWLAPTSDRLARVKTLARSL